MSEGHAPLCFPLIHRFYAGYVLLIFLFFMYFLTSYMQP